MTTSLIQLTKADNETALKEVTKHNDKGDRHR